jgi:hypothetical protein
MFYLALILVLYYFKLLQIGIRTLAASRSLRGNPEATKPSPQKPPTPRSSTPAAAGGGHPMADGGGGRSPPSLIQSSVQKVPPPAPDLDPLPPRGAFVPSTDGAALASASHGSFMVCSAHRARSDGLLCPRHQSTVLLLLSSASA